MYAFFGDGNYPMISQFHDITDHIRLGANKNSVEIKIGEHALSAADCENTKFSFPTLFHVLIVIYLLLKINQIPLILSECLTVHTYIIFFIIVEESQIVLYGSSFNIFLFFILYMLYYC